MARGVGFEQVRQAAISLMRQGRYPSVASVRAHIGAGSADTINEHMREVWRQMGEGLDTSLPGGIPETLLEPLASLWEVATQEAGARFQEERAAMRITVQQAEAARLEAEMSARDLVGRIEELREQISDRDTRLAEFAQEADRLRGSMADLQANLARVSEAHTQDRQRASLMIREQREKRRNDAVAFAEQVRQMEKRLEDERYRMERQERHWIMEVANARADAAKVRDDFAAYKASLEVQLADQRNVARQAVSDVNRMRDQLAATQRERDRLLEEHQRAQAEIEKQLMQATKDAENARRLAAEYSRETDMLRNTLMVEQSKAPAMGSVGLEQRIEEIYRELMRLGGKAGDAGDAGFDDDDDAGAEDD